MFRFSVAPPCNEPYLTSLQFEFVLQSSIVFCLTYARQPCSVRYFSAPFPSLDLAISSTLDTLRYAIIHHTTPRQPLSLVESLERSLRRLSSDPRRTTIRNAVTWASPLHSRRRHTTAPVYWLGSCASTSTVDGLAS